MPAPHSSDQEEHDGWEAYRIHVMGSLQRLDATVTRLWQVLDELKNELVAVKIKVAAMCAIFSFIGASVPVAIDLFIRWKDVSSR
ncbi:MAG: hypothetical protein ABSC42_15475 [Tepidisphaeraceae bacterium]|jgi:hypothetical protein